MAQKCNVIYELGLKCQRVVKESLHSILKSNMSDYNFLSLVKHNYIVF